MVHRQNISNGLYAGEEFKVVSAFPQSRCFLLRNLKLGSTGNVYVSDASRGDTRSN